MLAREPLLQSVLPRAHGHGGQSACVGGQSYQGAHDAGIPFRTDKKAAKALQASNHQRPAVTARCNVQANKYRRRDAIRHMVVDALGTRARIAATELGVGKGRGESERHGERLLGYLRPTSRATVAKVY